MGVVGLREVTYNAGNISKQVESSVSIVPRVFGISCLHVGIAEGSIQVLIPLGVLLVRGNIISQFVLLTVEPITHWPLEMM
jgi:hypothetical protein